MENSNIRTTKGDSGRIVGTSEVIVDLSGIRQVVRSWDAKTPNGSPFAAKVPQEITHEKVLKDCDDELKTFLTTMDTLGKKLGPLLFQFRGFDKYAFKSWIIFSRG